MIMGYMVEVDLILLFWFIVVLIITALPLHIAVKMLRGKSSILKVIGTNILVALVTFLIHIFIGAFATILSFIAMLFIYKSMFRMGWFRSFLAWLMQLVIIAIIVIILILVGILSFVF